MGRRKGQRWVGVGLRWVGESVKSEDAGQARGLITCEETNLSLRRKTLICTRNTCEETNLRRVMTVMRKLAAREEGHESHLSLRRKTEVQRRDLGAINTRKEIGVPERIQVRRQ